MNENQIVTTEAQKRCQEVVAYLASVSSVTVRTPEEMSSAAEITMQLHRHRKELDALREEHKAPVLQKGRDIDAAFKAVLEPIASMVRKLDTAIHQYREAADAKRREEQAKADAKAAKERADIMSKVFATEQAAAAMRAAGDDAKADAVEAKAAVFSAKAEAVCTTVVPSEAPQVKGLSTKEVWVVCVDSEEELVGWLIKTGKAGMLKPDLSQLNKWTDKNRSAAGLMRGAHIEKSVRATHRVVM